MFPPTFPRLAVVLFLGLAACNSPDTGTAVAAPASPDAWRLATGKAPSTAEFAALTATCQDDAKGGSFDSCLADLGLKRAQ